MNKIIDILLHNRDGLSSAEVASMMRRSLSSTSGGLSGLKHRGLVINRDHLWYAVEIPTEQLEKAKAYIRDQFEEGGDSEWLEGWICGYTDLDHGQLDQTHDELFRYLRQLRLRNPA